MFSPTEFCEKYNLSEVFRYLHPNYSKLTPGIIEFLDEQNQLISGTIYISTVRKATEYFTTHQPSISGYPLLIVCDAQEPFSNYSCNLSILAYSNGLGKVFNYLNEYIDLSGSPTDTMDFGNAWREICTNPNLKTADVWDMLKNIKHLVKPFMQLAVVDFENSADKNIPLKLVAKRLTAVIPHSIATVNRKEIIILITYTDRRFDYPFESLDIEPILKNYDGYLAISNGSRDLTNLSILHSLLKRMLLLAKSMNLLPDKRIYTFERLGMYLVIDICANGAPVNWKSDYVMYLAHPAAIAITRHDRNKNDNLGEVLYFYLSTNCSISECASILHMHRNTVMNKINKIYNLFKLDLTDRHVRQRLLFSLQIILYSKTYNLLKPE